MSKYNNIPTVCDGIQFASKLEARRYSELKLLQMGGVIRGLILQPKYPLVVNGVKIGWYYGDFLYEDVATGKEVLEDTKSKATVTPAYAIKRKLMKAIHGIDIVEVY